MKATHRTALLGLALACVANTPCTEFGFWPGTATSSSRSGLPGISEGIVKVKVDSGMGKTSSPHKVFGFRVIIQDQEAVTQDQFGFGAFDDDGSGNPVLPGNPCVVSGLTLPPGSGPAAWNISVSMQSPLQLTTDDFHFGVCLAANPAWPNDGLSVHTANWPIGDCTSSAAPSPVSSIELVPTLGLVRTPSPRTIALWVVVDGPLCEVGIETSSGSCFGLGGIYPRLAPGFGGIHIRVTDPLAANGLCFVLLGFGFAPVPIPIPGIGGALLIDPSTLVPFTVFSSPLDPSGQAAGTLIGPSSPLFGTMLPSLQLQAITRDMSSGAVRFSNAVWRHPDSP